MYAIKAGRSHGCCCPYASPKPQTLNPGCIPPRESPAADWCNPDTAPSLPQYTHICVGGGFNPMPTPQTTEPARTSDVPLLKPDNCRDSVLVVCFTGQDPSMHPGCKHGPSAAPGERALRAVTRLITHSSPMPLDYISPCTPGMHLPQQANAPRVPPSSPSTARLDKTGVGLLP